MRIQAWVQMGVERRETIIEIPIDEYEGGKNSAAEAGRSLEEWIEAYVRDWVFAQYGWGWSGAGFDNDFGCCEGSQSGGYEAYAVTSESSIPNTRAIKLDEAKDV